MVMMGSSGSNFLPGISTASPFYIDEEMPCIYVASSVSCLPLSLHLFRIHITRRGMASFYLSAMNWSALISFVHVCQLQPKSSCEKRWLCCAGLGAIQRGEKCL